MIRYPTPPHISVDQAKAFMSAFFKGDSAKWSMAKQSFRDQVSAKAKKRSADD
jgi:hypothetical protein